MKIKCFINSCKATPTFFCECSGFPEIMCENHCASHLIKKKPMLHTFHNVFKSVKDESQENLIKYYKEFIHSNEVTKTRIRQNTEKLLQNFDYILKLINYVNRLLKSNLSQIVKYKRIFNNYIYLKNCSADLKEIYEEGYDDLKMLINDSIDKNKISQSENSILYYSRQQTEIISNFSLKGWKDLDAKELFYFKQNTKKLYRFTPNDETVNITQIDSAGVQSIIPSICRIDKENLYVHGGNSSDSKNTPFLLNIKNYKVIPLQSYLNSHSTSCQLFNNKIFVFGGTINSQSSNYSRYFDFGLSMWVSLPQLPSYITNVSTLLLESEIYISAFQNFLYSFNSNTYQYKVEGKSLQIGNSNILIQYSGKIYVLAGDLVYKRKQYERNSEWKIRKTSISFQSTTSKPCYHGKNAYFVGQTMAIYRFDCEKKVLKII